VTALLLLALLAQTGEFEEDDNVLSSAPLTTSGHMATCTGDPLCLAQFLPLADAGCSAILGNGRALPCTCGAGSTVATVAYQGPNQTLPRLAWTNITDTSACSVAAGDAADAGLAAAVAGDGFTVQCAYYADGTDLQTVLGYGAYGVDGVYFTTRSTPNVSAYFGGDGGAPIALPSSTASAVKQWVVATASRAGLAYSVRVNGATATSTVGAGFMGAPTTRVINLGKYTGASGALGGAHAGCTMWSSRSGASLTRDEALWHGTVAETRNVTTTRASSGCWEPAADAGPMVKCVGVNAGRQDSRGLFSYAGESNAVPGLFSGWTLAHGNNADGGVTANPVLGLPGSCPHPSPMGDTSSAVKVDFPAIDESGTAGGSRVGYSVIRYAATVTAAPWIQDVWVRACDAADGGRLYQGMANLPTVSAPMDAGSTWQRYSVGYTMAGTTANVEFGPDTRGLVPQEPANQPALCACLWAPQVKLGSVPGPVVLCGAAPCSSAVDVPTVPVVSEVPPTHSGRWEVIYTPMNTEVIARCFVDTIAANNGLRLCTDASNQLVLTLGDGSATSTTTSAAQTFTANTEYRLTVEWGAGNAFVRKAGALVASTTNGTAKIPSAHAANYAVGNLIAGTSASRGWTKGSTWSRQ
jgi:hypothetical protein